MLNKPFVIIDVETTGTSGWADRVIEVGALRIENNEIVDEYKTLVNPQVRISPFIEEFTGIKQEELEDAPTFDSIKDRIYDLLDDAIFVAHNARFDYGFIKSELKRSGISYNAKTLCTVQLSRSLFPGHRHHNLSAIIDRFHLECKNRHRAYDDAFVLWQFLKRIENEVEPKQFEKVLNRLLKNSYSGDKYLAKQIEELPESAGVYIFYDDENIPLYVGKSKNIKERVITHFVSNYGSTRELSLTKSTKRIDYIQTAGEMGALLTESRLIKELSPIYNRVLRQKKQFVTLSQTKLSNGFLSMKIGVSEKIDKEKFNELYGVFKNKKSAKDALFQMVKKYALCSKLMGIEKTHGSCFEYKLGVCRGACCGKESREKYNARFLIAYIENKQFRAWPYNGAIEIVEKNDEEELCETFMVKDWCIVENKKRKGDAIETVDLVDFDIDSYKIIHSFIKYHSPKIRSTIY